MTDMWSWAKKIREAVYWLSTREEQLSKKLWRKETFTAWSLMIENFSWLLLHWFTNVFSLTRCLRLRHTCIILIERRHIPASTSDSVSFTAGAQNSTVTLQMLATERWLSISRLGLRLVQGPALISVPLVRERGWIYSQRHLSAWYCKNSNDPKSNLNFRDDVKCLDFWRDDGHILRLVNLRANFIVNMIEVEKNERTR